MKEDEELEEDTSEPGMVETCEVDGVTYNLGKPDENGNTMAIDTVEFTELGAYNEITNEIDFIGEEEEELHKKNVEEAE